MAHPVLTAKHFQDETAAFAYVESILWPNGPVCPFCGSGELPAAVLDRVLRTERHSLRYESERRRNAALQRHPERREQRFPAL